MGTIDSDPDFEELIRVVAARRGLSLATVRLDYGLTRALASLQARGLDVLVTGTTSLYKGFKLIHRLSQRLECRVGARDLALAGALAMGADLQVMLPGDDLLPAVPRSISSFVHDELERDALLASYQDVRPELRCVHPDVVLLEQLGALSRLVPDPDVAPTTFIHHFEDAARVIEARRAQPSMPGMHVRALVERMLRLGRLPNALSSGDPAFTPDSSPRWRDVRSTYRAVAPQLWGPRLKLAEACQLIQRWIASTLEG